MLTDLPEDAELHHAEAVALANDTEHGLSCGILTENGTHGPKPARRVRTGIVHVNDQSVDRHRLLLEHPHNQGVPCGNVPFRHPSRT